MPTILFRSGRSRDAHASTCASSRRFGVRHGRRAVVLRAGEGPWAWRTVGLRPRDLPTASDALRQATREHRYPQGVALRGQECPRSFFDPAVLVTLTRALARAHADLAFAMDDALWS